jgi:hypothetical protein
MVDLVSGPGNITPESLPGRAFPRLPDEANPQAYGTGVGRGIEQAADVLQQTHDQVQAQARQTMVTDAHNQTQALSLKLTMDPQTGAFTKQGQNAFGLDGQYLPQFDQGVQQIAAGIPDQRARQLYLTQVAPQTRNHLSEQLDTHELTQHKAYEGQTIQSGIELAGAQAAANFNHPDILSANKDHVNFLVDQMAKNQGWSTETTEANRQKALSEFHGNVIDSMMGQGQAKQAQTYLFQASAAGEVDPKAAESLQRVIQAKQEHDLMMADKQQRDASNSVLKNMIQLNEQGKLTPQYIEKFHNTLEPQAYEMGYRMLSGKEATTDPHTYAPLMVDSMSGKDVTQPATDALYSGKLSLTDFKSLIQNTDRPRSNYVKRGAEYISTSLKPSSLLPDPTAQRSLANALSDWDQTVKDNPDMTEEEANKRSRIITDHYAQIHSDQVTRANAVPLYLVGSREQPNIQATAAETKAAHDRGEMSDETYRQQQQLILQWVGAQPKTPPKAQP